MKTDLLRCSRRERLTRFALLWAAFLAGLLLAAHCGWAAERDEVIVKYKPGRLISVVPEVKYLPRGARETPAKTPLDLDFDDALQTLRGARAAVKFKNEDDFDMPQNCRLVIA